MVIDLEQISALARRGRIDIIRTLRQYPDRNFSINELAKVSRIPVMTCWRAVRELTGIGLLKVRKIANSSIVSLNITPELMRLLRQISDSDPHRYAALMFARQIGRLPGIVEARLFGRVAKGDHTPESEADIAVIFEHIKISQEDASAHADRIAKEVESLTGTRISPHLVRKDHLDQGRGFAAELRDKESLWRRAD